MSSISFMQVVSHLEKITLAFVQLLKKNLFALFFGQNTFLYMAFIVIYLQNCHLNFGNMQDCAILDNKILLFKFNSHCHSKSFQKHNILFKSQKTYTSFVHFDQLRSNSRMIFVQFFDPLFSLCDENP